MSDKMTVWNTLEKTDPAHTKAFQRSGGFKGTAVKPIYCDKRMTELFGTCGEGWGIGKPEFQVVAAGNEILVYCTVGVWHGKPENIIYGVGGDKVLADQSKGLKTSDEAFKMAFTDAIGNAYKHLGMSADIHMGRFDDAKYVREMEKEFGGTQKKVAADKSEEPAHVRDAKDILAKAAKITDADEMDAFVKGCGERLQKIKAASGATYDHVMAKIGEIEAAIRIAA